MSNDDPAITQAIKRLTAVAARARLRLRLQAAIASASALLPIPLIYVLAALTSIKLFHEQPHIEGIVLWGAGVPVAIVLFGVGHSLLSSRPPLTGARALDGFHHLSDRISNALAFAALAPEHRSPFMWAAIRDAADNLHGLQPARAVPLLRERRTQLKDLGISALLAGLIFGVSLLEVRTTLVVPVPSPQLAPAVLHQDDVDLLRHWAQGLDEKTTDPDARSAVRQFNQLVEDIAERRLDRRQIFQKLAQLENQLRGSDSLNQGELDESLKALARELEKSSLSKPIAESLEARNLEDAEQALRKLAERLKQRPQKLNRAELERLRQALERAGAGSKGRLDRIEAQRQSLEQERKRLLKKKDSGKPLSNTEQRQLDQKNRQLKRLDRQKKRTQAAQQQLSQLDRELAKAAAELRKELGDAAQSLERGAEALHRMAKQQLSNREKEKLKQQLEELRELLRQAKKGSKNRERLLEQFRQAARGNSKKAGQAGGNSQQGKRPGGPGKLQLGSGTANIPVPGQGNPQTGSGNQGPSGEGASDWGSGHDDNIAGKQTHPDGQARDVAAAGIDSGEGDASSEAVFGAAERGFSGGAYKKVYADYETVAEEVMEHDEIPPGYKFYVRRYFQLIRPRE